MEDSEKDYAVFRKIQQELGEPLMEQVTYWLSFEDAERMLDGFCSAQRPSRDPVNGGYCILSKKLPVKKPN